MERKKINLNSKASDMTGDTSVTDLQIGNRLTSKSSGFSQEVTILEIIKDTPKMITFLICFEHGGNIKPGRTCHKTFRKKTFVNLTN